MVTYDIMWNLIKSEINPQQICSWAQKEWPKWGPRSREVEVGFLVTQHPKKSEILCFTKAIAGAKNMQTSHVHMHQSAVIELWKLSLRVIRFIYDIHM